MKKHLRHLNPIRWSINHRHNIRKTDSKSSSITNKKPRKIANKQTKRRETKKHELNESYTNHRSNNKQSKTEKSIFKQSSKITKRLHLWLLRKHSAYQAYKTRKSPWSNRWPKREVIRFQNTTRAHSLKKTNKKETKHIIW